MTMMSPERGHRPHQEQCPREGWLEEERSHRGRLFTWDERNGRRNVEDARRHIRDLEGVRLSTWNIGRIIEVVKIKIVVFGCGRTVGRLFGLGLVEVEGERTLVSIGWPCCCLLYTSDAADDRIGV